MTLHEKGILTPEALLPLINQRGSLYRLSPDMVLSRAWSKREQVEPMVATKDILTQLLRYARNPTGVTIDVLPEPEPVLQLEPPRLVGRRRILSSRR